MKKLMHILLLSCLKATELIEKKFHFKLSFRERLQLKMHKSICKACSMYEKQSSVLHEALMRPDIWNGEETDLEGFKKEILKNLDKKPGKQ